MEMTRERISFAFDQRDMLLSLQTGLSVVRAAVAWQSLRQSQIFSHDMKQLLITVPRFCPFTLISLWMPLGLFFISLIF